MDHETLVNEQIEAGRQLITEFDRLVPVQFAFWLKSAEDGKWFLYIVPDHLEQKDRTARYGDLGEVWSRLQSPYLNPSRLKLITPDDPLSQAIREVHTRYPNPARLGIRYNGQYLGGMPVDGAYLYPLPSTVP